MTLSDIVQCYNDIGITMTYDEAAEIRQAIYSHVWWRGKSSCDKSQGIYRGISGGCNHAGMSKTLETGTAFNLDYQVSLRMMRLYVA